MKAAFLGGADSPHVIKWVNALAERGHDITLYSMPNQKDELNEIVPQVNVQYLGVPEAADGLRKNQKEVKELVAAGGYRAVAAFDMLTYGSMAARAHLPNVLLVSTGNDVINGLRAGQKSALQKAIKGAAAVCASAANIITEIKDLLPKEREYFVTPFGVDMGLFRKRDVKRPDTFTFGSLKRPEYYNHVEYVIEAFAKFCEKAEMDAMLRVVGHGPAIPELEARAKELHVEDKVEFLGYVRNVDMPQVINTLDVSVQMPDEEALGTAGIESMACEVPVIASETNGASEYILNGVTGFLVRAGNVERCADKMVLLAKDPKLRESMGFHGREDVKENYNLPKCVDKFEEALQAASGSRVN